eukprot:m.50249 g.50249  ORF g.50249 m.50249 type:complete len:480 (+) comp15369_c0_seq1:122-1561(+)
MNIGASVHEESASRAFSKQPELTHWLKTISDTVTSEHLEDNAIRIDLQCKTCSIGNQSITHSGDFTSQATEEHLQTIHDVIIIGAGITGCSLAYYLSTFGGSCLVLDARNVAHGGTGRNGGIIWPNEQDDFQLHTVSMIRDFVKRNGVECDFRPCGGVYLETDDEHEERLGTTPIKVPREDGGGPDCEYEGRYERVDPVKILHASTNAFARAYLEPAVISLHAAKLARAYAQCAVDTGRTTIIPNCFVSDVDEHATPIGRESASSDDSDDRVVHIQTSLGLFRCRRVVVATNGWIPRLLPELKQHMDPCVGTVLASQAPLPESLRWPVSCISYGEAENELYGSMTADGYLVLGGLRDCDARWCDGDDDTEVDEQNVQLLKAWFAKFFPDIAKEIEFGMAWNGTMGNPVDETPIFGQVPGRSGRVFVCGGYCGEGMTRSVGMALGMAELLAGNTVTKAELLLGSYNVARFWNKEGLTNKN